MIYKCPLCGSPLTESHFHRVIKLQDKKEKHQKGELDKLKKQVAAAKRKEQETRAKAKQSVEDAKKEAANNERRKTAIRFQRMIPNQKTRRREENASEAHLPSGDWPCR
jgi:DNA repair exonuclease SbcCD ATPase subunit